MIQRCRCEHSIAVTQLLLACQYGRVCRHHPLCAHNALGGGGRPAGEEYDALLIAGHARLRVGAVLPAHEVFKGIRALRSVFLSALHYHPEVPAGVLRNVLRLRHVFRRADKRIRPCKGDHAQHLLRQQAQVYQCKPHAELLAGVERKQPFYAALHQQRGAAALFQPRAPHGICEPIGFLIQLSVCHGVFAVDRGYPIRKLFRVSGKKPTEKFHITSYCPHKSSQCRKPIFSGSRTAA